MGVSLQALNLLVQIRFLALSLQASHLSGQMHLSEGALPLRPRDEYSYKWCQTTLIWHRRIAGFKVRSCPWLIQRRFRESVARRIIKRQFAFKRRYRPLSAYKLSDLV